MEEKRRGYRGLGERSNAIEKLRNLLVSTSNGVYSMHRKGTPLEDSHSPFMLGALIGSV